jgi:hypothetical protein
VTGKGPCHPQHPAHWHHQVDRDLVALQHHERYDRDHKREDVEPGQGDAFGEQDLGGEVDGQVGDHTDDRRRNPNKNRPEPAVVGQKLYVRCQKEDKKKARQERRIGSDKSPKRPVEQG